MQQIISYKYGKFSCEKTHPFTLVLRGAFGFSFVLGSSETEQLDIEHHFLILSEFHTKGFSNFSQRKLGSSIDFSQSLKWIVYLTKGIALLRTYS